MESKTKIAVIGGTGKSGKYLVEQLVNQSIPFKILLRNPEKFHLSSSLIEIVKGDVRDYASIHALLDGCNAIISTLGLGQPPSEASIFSQATINILRAMQEYAILRYIVITGLNVATPFDKKSSKTKYATEWMYTHYPKTTLDKQLEYDILATSSVNWTLIRLPLIELTTERRKIQVSLEDCPGEKITATDIAHFLLEQLTTEKYVKQAPFIANV